MAVFVVVGRFFVRSIAAQSPEHEPEQGAAGINVPRPPRCVNGTEDEERDDVINEEESSHGAFVFMTDAKLPHCRMRLGNVVKL